MTWVAEAEQSPLLQGGKLKSETAETFHWTCYGQTKDFFKDLEEM